MIILADVRYLLYRSHFTTGGLSFNDIPTGAIFGLLQTLKTFDEAYPGSRFLLCCDKGIPQIRAQLCPEYKGGRNVDPDVREEIRIQESILLEESPLPIWTHQGFEADDLMASFCQNWPEGDDIILITNDKDLYSLLKSNVRIRKSISNPEFTVEMLAEDYHGATPGMWPLIKAVAGDKSDNISGLRGYREKRASKAVIENTVDFKDPEVRSLIERNLAVVQLQSHLTDWLEPEILNASKWNAFCKKWGIVRLLIGESMDEIQKRMRDANPDDYSYPE